jgi:site-specific DNA-methyltransferase (adenine-specific)/adenine-specific DNA-methyltransferase
VPESLWFAVEAGTTREATGEIAEILGAKGGFDTPKPVRLIQRILQIATDKDSLILDSFAGSGTTGHAVLKQNAEDGGKRRFILVEMDDNIARNVTAERVKRVAQGYRKGKDALTSLPEGEGKDWVAGLGGGFQFCTLSKEPLFTAEGQIRSDVRFAQLAEFVWFRETGSGLPVHPSTGSGRTALNSPLLGVHAGRAIYLLYNVILKDKSVNGGNVLTGKVLEVLPAFDGPKVIYAAACRLGEPRLRREGIVFKQTPYALAV